MFSPSKDKIDKLYVSLQEDLKIKDDGYLNKCIEIELYRHPYGSIHTIRNYLIQRIVNMIPGMYKSSDKPTPVFEPPLEKNEGYQAIKMTLITDK